jgi:hypothetical protein
MKFLGFGLLRLWEWQPGRHRPNGPRVACKHISGDWHLKPNKQAVIFETSFFEQLTFNIHNFASDAMKKKLMTKHIYKYIYIEVGGRPIILYLMAEAH